MIDPVALTSLTSAVTLLGTEFLKGAGGEAGKATWAQVKSLFGWTSDPAPAELPAAVTTALNADPDLAPELTRILQQSGSANARQLVGNISADGGKVVVAQIINTTSFTM